MYLLIENFNSGLDSRRMALTSKPGTLQQLENAHITRGGEIEKRKAFDAIAYLPTGTFGLHSANGALWVFGSADSLDPNVFGALPPSPAPESFYVPRVNYMKLDTGGYQSTLQVAPFVMTFYDRPYDPSVSRKSDLQGVLIATIPPGGEVPTIPYQTFHITFSNLSGPYGSPPNGLYKVNRIRTDASGTYKLAIYPNGPYDIVSGTIFLGYAFSNYVGSVHWTSDTNPNSSTPQTGSLDAKFGVVRRCKRKDDESIGVGLAVFPCIDGFWVPHSPLGLLSRQDTVVKPCTVVIEDGSLPVFPLPASQKASCLFIVGAENDPGESSLIYVAVPQSGVNSLSYYATATPKVSFSTFVSFYPSSDLQIKNYPTAKEWLRYAADQLADAINKNSVSNKLTAIANAGYVTITSYDSYYNPLTTINYGWSASMPVYSYPPGQPSWDASVYAPSRRFSGGVQMTELLSADNFQGKIYAIARFENGVISHFYNGKRVTSWDAIATSSGDPASIAASFALQIKLDGVYESTSLDDKVFIQFFKKNTSYTVTASSINGGGAAQGITITTTPADSDSPQFTVVQILGDYEQYDVFTIAIDSVNYTAQAGASVVGRFCRTHMDKMYSASGSLLYFSETSTNGGPSAFTNDTINGAGVINLSSQDSGSSALTSIALYQGKLAIFSESSVQVWTMSADPKLNSFSQILNNVGTSAPNSVVSLGNIDTYFLSQLGVRSLRARDASNVAIVSDVGNPIDDMILYDVSQLSSLKRDAAFGLIDPVDGRYWLSVGPKVYVYSYFPSSGINAWSVYMPTVGPDRIPIEISHLCTLNNRIYARSGNFVYAYGGLTGSRYDESIVKVQMPYLDGGKPAHFKTISAVDSACIGEWDIYVGSDISAPESFDYIGKIQNSTYSNGRIMATAIGTHASIKMSNSADGYAKIGNFAVHFEINDAG
jgi:hypothetical protein